MPAPAVAEDIRFWSKVVQEEDCWIWTGNKNKKGYGRFFLSPSRKEVRAHRWAYEQMVGEVPEGLLLDHECFTPSCVNPYHLNPVPNTLNSTRRRPFTHYNTLKTHCKRGHPFDEENTYAQTGGGRGCVACTKLPRR